MHMHKRLLLNFDVNHLLELSVYQESMLISGSKHAGEIIKTNFQIWINN